MNHLKDHVREVYPTIDHFLTYGASAQSLEASADLVAADNYADASAARS